MADMEAAIGVITETWLADGDSLQEDLDGLALGTGLKMLCKNRKANDMGFAHGGVSIIYREAMITLKEVRLHNPHDLEVMMAVGSIRGSMRKVAVIAVSYTHLTLPTIYSV